MTVTYHAPAHPGMRYPGFVEPKLPRRVDAPAEGGRSPSRSPNPPSLPRPSAQRSPDPSAFPSLDDHLVRPETREEMVGGRLVLSMPALEPHAERHHELDYVTRGVVAPGYVGATDLLTRTDGPSQFAADTCIRREGIDPATGLRYLEELAFEVVNEQSLGDITERASFLSSRGVRRIVAIFVKLGEVREWSPELDDWITLDPNGTFEDPTIVEPLPVRALLDRSAANRAVVQGLKAKQDPAILEVRAEGIAQAIVTLCTALDIPLDAERRAHLRALDTAGLEALLTTIGVQHRWP